GNLVYPAHHPLTVSVEGAGRLLGVDNGDQNDTTALSKSVKVANGGQVLVVLQAGRSAGKISVKVDAPGLKSGQWELPVK
ncbi:MAG TPA: hypothetical protein VK327_18595, partial [Candidatus Paceibacterota bacterium]|nr:hypothetical protein [Candidatus Paceibacterota bacterium]